MTTDGHKAYLYAIDAAFGGEVDYAQLVKLYGAAPESAKGRYQPRRVHGYHQDPLIRRPDMKHVSTSYAERNNLNVRMHSRRMTRLTNAFSKKMENHAHAMALHFLYYNFVRIHKTLKVTPAMAAGVTDRLWEVADTARAVFDQTDAPSSLRAKGKHFDWACFPRRRGASPPPLWWDRVGGRALPKRLAPSRSGRGMKRNASGASELLGFRSGATPHPGPPPQGGRECARRFHPTRSAEGRC